MLTIYQRSSSLKRISAGSAEKLHGGGGGSGRLEVLVRGFIENQISSLDLRLLENYK